MTVKIMLADDHAIVRQGLKSLLTEEEGFEVVAEAKNGKEAVKIACELMPDIIVMDVGMPELNGIEATRRIAKDCPRVKIIALSMHYDKKFVSGMLLAGASGYLLKDSIYEDLVNAIRAVLRGDGFLSPKIANVVIEGFSRGHVDQKEEKAQALTSREREVLQLIAEGLSSKEIAGKLCISLNTVEKHRKNIMEKLEIHNIVELTKYAIRHGLTSA